MLCTCAYVCVCVGCCVGVVFVRMFVCVCVFVCGIFVVCVHLRMFDVVYTWVNVINTCNAKGWGSEGEYIYVVRIKRVHCSRSKQS